MALEAKAEHPIARAILERAEVEGVEVEETTDFRAFVGRGVEACVDDTTCCIGNLRLFEELDIPVVDGVVHERERPIRLESASQVEVHARSLRCTRCETELRVEEHLARTVEDRPLRLVRLVCPMCGTRRDAWFRIDARLPS